MKPARPHLFLVLGATLALGATLVLRTASGAPERAPSMPTGVALSDWHQIDNDIGIAVDGVPKRAGEAVSATFYVRSQYGWHAVAFKAPASLEHAR